MKIKAKDRKRLRNHRAMMRFFNAFDKNLSRHRENLINVFASYKGRRRKSIAKTVLMFVDYIDSSKRARKDLRKGIVY
ncbi:MAG: hypothetical protein A2Y71_03035 [Bacteroidetes bacterium RBG_13_42_15]|nr:MAG: hypothetical protein A2Y71_03035 [Bacteroidetes bacterium RBG_13_42_15]